MSFRPDVRSHYSSRRKALRGAAGLSIAALSTRLFTVKGAFAEALTPTGQSGEGPLYPDKMPRDTDNDLILVNDAITPGIGEITHLSGRILDRTGTPMRNTFVEIWQCDSQGVYRHTSHEERYGENYDHNFQGYGRFLTGPSGGYYFRTIKPVIYGTNGVLRTPHIHFAVSNNGERIFTTEMNIKDHPENETDIVFKRRTEAEKKSVSMDFVPMPDSTIGELSCDFDIVLGVTANDTDGGTLKGGIGASTWNRG